MTSSILSSQPSAINSIARSQGTTWAGSTFCLIFLAAALAGCSGLPDKPTRATMYDFGPGLLATPPEVEMSSSASACVKSWASAAPYSAPAPAWR